MLTRWLLNIGLPKWSGLSAENKEENATRDLSFLPWPEVASEGNAGDIWVVVGVLKSCYCELHCVCEGRQDFPTHDQAWSAEEWH